jgi:ion channel-forming bestrophin family protein
MLKFAVLSPHMVNYDPRDWFGLIFHFHKSDTFRKLFWVIVSVGLYSWLVIYLELVVFNMHFTSTVMHSLLGFVISLLLVFRTNTAYERWWEGRKQWGALVNVSRNLAMKSKTFIAPNSPSVHANLMSLISLFPFVLKEHMRNANYGMLSEQLRKELDKFRGNSMHAPNALAKEMFKQAGEALKAGNISASQELTILSDLKEFTDICGACERIKKTPIPYNYNIFIKKFIFVYIVTMPIGFAVTFNYWTILVTTFTFYTLASLELIAESIEDPFGLDPDDLPTDEISETIARNLLEI